MAEGMLFHIQHFSVHDGPGIRTTVFFKGCMVMKLFQVHFANMENCCKARMRYRFPKLQLTHLI